ncbi:MAG TPA: hypothetical protein VJB87_00450 [Candidatus Nanoarchaeia archaeon]|nr:hypothetical protein [Candidatus Nanoarchaeia archaeon]
MNKTLRNIIVGGSLIGVGMGLGAKLGFDRGVESASPVEFTTISVNDAVNTLQGRIILGVAEVNVVKDISGRVTALHRYENDKTELYGNGTTYETKQVLRAYR